LRESEGKAVSGVVVFVIGYLTIIPVLVLANWRSFLPVIPFLLIWVAVDLQPENVKI